MREILFRGKRVDNGEWVDGMLVYNLEGDISIVDYINKNEYKSTNPIHSESVGQFTGLLDKNGKKIFEGDVICLDGVKFWEIRFIGRGFIAVPHEDQVFQQVLENNNYYQFEVIGNIHDNPELIK